MVNKAFENQDVKREYNSYIQKLKNGYPPEKLGQRTKDNFFLIKGKHARILVEISKNKDDIKILGVGFRGNIRNFYKTMNSEYNADLQYTKF